MVDILNHITSNVIHTLLLFSHPVVSDSLSTWTAAHQSFLSLAISWHLPKFMSIALVMPSSHLILWCPLLLCSIFPRIRNFSNESAVLIRWPKYKSFIFSISPSNKFSWLIFLKIDWFDLFPMQGTLRSLLQHHSSKASILYHSAFLMVQLSEFYQSSTHQFSRILQLLGNHTCEHKSLCFY